MSTLDNTRKSYFLSVTPVNYSLTDGTNIPPPTSPLQQPPTPGGGPLSSHPTTPPESEREATTSETATSPTDASRERSDSFRTPTSPASPHAHRPKGVRKLLSLTNLRASFSSSRTSLSQPRQSNDTHSTINASNASHATTSYKRPFSPTTTASLAPSTVVSITGGARPPLRQQKSSNWFKRKSSLFLLNANANGNGELDTVEEGGRPESKRLKESDGGREVNGAPLLPDLGALRGGRVITGGDLGWDEGAFKRDLVA